MKGFRQHILRRDGIALTLYVQEGEGPLMVFQHGLCGDAAQPAAVFPHTSGARLAVLECRGHGASEAGDPAAFAIATFADDVATAIRMITDRPCVVGGISMGAAIAMRLAVREPGLVRGLVIARPAWSFSDAPANMRPNLAVGECLRKQRTAGEADAFVASGTGRMLAAESPDNLKSLLSFFTREPRSVTAELLVRISGDGPGVTRAELSALRVPTLVIGNSEDHIHPLSLATEIADAIPGARFREIPAKTHGKEAYESAFRAGLGTFLQEITP
ncbi:alpha/beta fold hydrolase [Aestuariivirga sp.]|uniref:alpha/beta fold hydrolase n=1 Tax=Aestuariivirga sp. TaxID=2650926 RepID=UPI0039E2E761